MAWRLILNRAFHHIGNVTVNRAEDRALVDLFSVAGDESKSFG